VRTRWPERWAIAALLVCTACGRGSAVPPPPAERPRDGGILTYAIDADPVSVTPLYGGDAAGLVVERNVFAGLVNDDPGTLRPVPAIAESWTSSPDGRSYTFHLRAGVRFSGGAGAVTAQTFVDDWNLLCSPDVHSPNASVLAPVAGYAGCVAGGRLSGVRAEGARTLVVTLSRPVRDLPARLVDPATWAFPPELEATPQQRTAFEQAPVGAGPFMVDTIRHSERPQGKAPVTGLVVLSRNPGFFGPRPHLDAIRMPVVAATEAARTIAGFRAGRYRVFPVPISEADAVRADLIFGRRLLVAPRLTVYALRSTAGTPSQRLAVAGALDRSQVVELALGKSAQAADGLLPLGMPGYVPDAARYLRVPGTGLNVTLTHQRDATLAQLTAAVAQMLRAKGATARVVPHGQWSVTEIDLSSPSPGAAMAALASPLAASVDAAAGDARAAALQRAQRGLLDTGTIVPLAFGQTALLVSPRVHDLRLDALGAPQLDVTWLTG
jgi:ABC-type transport system substrate-binding protein